VIGGLLLAGVETLAQAGIENGTAYRQVFAFLLVIAFLVFRPAGLFGRAAMEKV
jgi:branched-subunit amino acid ABC-type transport system permease component